MPLEEYGFVLNKKKFRNAVNIRYIKQTLNCETGDFVTIRHNKVRDFKAQLLKETCNDVEIKPALQPIEGEIVEGLNSDNAKPDIRTRDFWGDGQNAYFDVRITNTNVPPQSYISAEGIFMKHEKEKKRQCNR